MAKITYEDKEFLNKNENIADKNKVNDTDLNEIKEVVNGNDDNIGDLSDLNTTDKSSVVNAINNLVGYTLYDNSSGTTTNFSLNDDVANYKYIEIFTKQDGYYNAYKSQKLYDPEGKKIQINYFSYHTDGGRIQFFGETISFSGMSATVGDKFGYVLGNQNYGTTGDSLKIVKINSIKKLIF